MYGNWPGSPSWVSASKSARSAASYAGSIRMPLGVTRVFLPARCGGPHYRPTRIVLACSDGNLQLLSLR